MEKIFNLVSKGLNIPIERVKNTIQLLDDGATVPFISRYRKEVTGNLDEVQIGNILEKVNYLRNLEKRKEEVIRLIEEQGKLTDELKINIEKAEILQEVEDIYFPYRKKKKTKADIAKEKGLEPLAEKFYVLSNFEELKNAAEAFINEEVLSVEEAIEGAMLIIAQNISEKIEYRERIREIYTKDSIIDIKASKKATELDEKKVYA
ncbi:Tex-like N-terminal domain-containing protein, partial [Fusobacterium sp.]